MNRFHSIAHDLAQKLDSPELTCTNPTGPLTGRDVRVIDERNEIMFKLQMLSWMNPQDEETDNRNS